MNEKIEAALRFFAKAGRDTAQYAEPGYWPCEKRDRAAKYAERLPALRKLYAELRDAKSIAAAHQTIKAAEGIVKTGVEYNCLSLAEACLNGDADAIRRATEEC